MTSSRRFKEVESGRTRILLRALENIKDKKQEALRAANAANLDSQLLAVETTYKNIKDSLKSTSSLGEITVEGLAEALSRAASTATEVEAGTLSEIQEKLDVEKTKANGEKEVRTLMQKQSESAEQLNMALKLERAKRQQQLQAKLNKKKKK